MKQRLASMRRMVDQYQQDQGKRPSSLDALVKQGYLFEILPDPITGKTDWQVKIDEDKGDGNGGIAEIRSNAKGKDNEGVLYRDY